MHVGMWVIVSKILFRISCDGTDYRATTLDGVVSQHTTEELKRFINFGHWQLYSPSDKKLQEKTP
jgi:hypothetical protein